MKQFVDQAENLWKNKQIMSQELIHLYEAFVTISAEMKEPEQQGQFIAYLLESPKKEWNNILINQLCSSEPLLLKSLGIVPEPNPQLKQQLVETLEKTTYIMNLFTGIAKQATKRKRENKPFAFPMGNYILAIISNVMALIRTLHSIQSPQILQHIPPDFRYLVATVEERGNQSGVGTNVKNI